MLLQTNFRVKQMRKANGHFYHRRVLGDFRFASLKDEMTDLDQKRPAKDELSVHERSVSASWSPGGYGAIVPKEESDEDRKNLYRKAWVIENAYSQYYEYMNDLMQKVKKDHPQWSDAELSKGITEKMTEGFDIPREKIGKPLSAQAKADLFEIDHRLNLQYDLIRRAFDLSNDENQAPEIKPQIDQVLNDPFAIRVKEALIKVGRNPNEATRYVQENDWKDQFQIWNTVGVTRLKMGTDGKFTNQKVTLEQLQDEIISDDILSQSK